MRNSYGERLLVPRGLNEILRVKPHTAINDEYWALQERGRRPLLVVEWLGKSYQAAGKVACRGCLAMSRMASTICLGGSDGCLGDAIPREVCLRCHSAQTVSSAALSRFGGSRRSAEVL